MGGGRNKLFQTFPMSNLKNNLPGIPGKYNRAWILTDPPVYIRLTWYPAVSGGKSVIRLSLVKLFWLSFCEWSNGLIPH